MIQLAVERRPSSHPGMLKRLLPYMNGRRPAWH